MKRYFILVLTLILVFIVMSACADPGTYEKGQFFDEAYLSEKSLSSLPSPSLEDAVLVNGHELYLNISGAEYISYVKEIAAYLLSRDDVHHLSYEVSREYLMLIPMDIICVPIDESFQPDRDDISIFFSLEEEWIEKSGSEYMSSPIQISLSRSVKKVHGREYNCRITLSSDVVFGVKKADPCYFDHTYAEEGETLIVPWRSGVQELRKYTCIYCGETRFSDFIGDMKQYSVSFLDGKKYIINEYIPDTAISGIEYTFYTSLYCDVDLIFEVNGIRIAQKECELDGKHCWSYTFIMPCEDVEIKAYLVGGA